MIVTETCEHCFFYDKDEHRCLKHNRPVSNVATCSKWKPGVRRLSSYELPVFEEYNEYCIDEGKE